MANKNLTVTPLTELQNYSARGELVELPPFSRNQRFVARLRRPSLLVLMKTGKIPNALLGTASKLFAGEGMGSDSQGVADFVGVAQAVAEASFVEPTWEELTDAGVELTDEQLIFVFNYSQREVTALETFRGDE